MLAAPIDKRVSAPMQVIVVVTSYTIWVSLLFYGLYLRKKEKTWFYVIIAFAAGFGGIFEPIYDNALMLYFYGPGQWTAFTSMGVPQPVWVYSGYATLYGTVSVFLNRQIASGIKRRLFFRYAIIELASSCLFEIVVINGGVYEYWGPHVLRIFKYPIVICILETVQVMFYSVAVANLRARTNRAVYHFFGALLIFPITFMAANIGVGAPLIISLHSSIQTEALVTLGTMASILGSVIAILALPAMIPGIEEGVKLPTHLSESNTHIEA
ncbi:hypothetical protein K4K49_001233 [Colletotrichum sp. SAR 10_70]|nr:hypothetical protein K4K50_006138 [Colletotrichum sp. SAR 10_71]KAI8181277.1 hypothetical protein K4K49_001233 [Colletotrichum sp. SAR 10_70]KAI8195620.1 hypothetical protein KHU50_010724 [Colletotrichum sp. SAR 10_65]KAI8252093.1 hypothetical protein K4K53_011518 [Colletotrichum sp. SAR 10_77]KAJ5000026.1 hypothetical protein K4K48_003227 [Colletotrichum sp. SAR 10_66]